MDDLQRKLDVLENIAAKLNVENILWAVGASVLLYFKGITDSFHDIDIMVAEKDAPRCKDILRTMGTMAPPNPNPQYKTRTFLEFVIGDVEVDVMAGFVIVENGQEHDCALTPDQIAEDFPLGGERIPLQSVALWRQYYAWMGRPAKVRMIDRACNTPLSF